MNPLEVEQPIIYKSLNNMIEKDEVPQALIFYGDKSASKKEMVLHLAASMYAKLEGTSVELSNSARRIKEETHTNVIFVESNSSRGEVTKKQMEDVILPNLTLSSLEPGPRFLVFVDAPNLSLANMLLKFIEEPQDDLYIIFIVDSLTSVLPTIKSRCALFNFRSLNKDLLIEKLVKEDFDQKMVKVVVEYTQSEKESTAILENEECIRIIDFVCELFLTRVEDKESMVLYYKENEALIKDEFSKDFFLSLVVFYLKDILNYKAFHNEIFIFESEKVRIKELSSFVDDSPINDTIKKILEIKQRLSVKVNFRINVDYLLYNLENIFRK